MKLKSALTILAGVVAFSARAALYTYNFNGINTAIPDGDVAGLTDTHSLSGMNGWISDISVSVNISGGYNGDLYGYLVSDSGFAVLLNGVGRTGANPYGSPGSGMIVTFNDTTGTDIHYAPGTFGTQLAGTWASDGRNVDPVSVLDTDARTATLSSFIGGNPNGNWTLFLADTSPIGESSLNGWSLEISTVPEPTTWALIGFGLMFAGTGLVRRRQLRRTSEARSES
jgi:subtilisin-like proprotein convertase family protein